MWLTVLLCLFALALIWLPNIQSLLSQPREEHPSPSVTFPNGVAVTLELADTQAERVQGLSGHAPLAQDGGMLFLHDEKKVQGYWMKDMLFAIDLIWIDGDTVVGFQEDAQPEDPARTIYYSPVPVDGVLEVSAGFVAQNEVLVGDVLDVELLDE